MRLEDVFAGVLGVPADTLGDDSGPATLPMWDSLRHLGLVTAIEDVYGVALTVEEMRSMKTLGAARRMLAERGIA